MTTQRVVLHDVLRELDTHVTAEEVMTAAGDRLPGLSLPTVYATLELFEQAGIVRRVPVSGGAALFDPRTRDHAHLVCRSCGAVEDVDAALDTGPVLAAAAAGGATVDRAELVLSGLCARCAQHQRH